MQPDPKHGAWLAQLQRFDAPCNPTMPGYRQTERIESMHQEPARARTWITLLAVAVAVVALGLIIAWGIFS